MKIMLCLAVLSLAAPALSFAQGKTFYGDSKRGWYWYEDPSRKAGKVKTEKKEIPSISLKGLSDEELWSLDADSFSTLREAITKQAVSDPADEENLGDYVRILDITRRRSLAFANAYQAYLSKKPEFNMASASPLAEPGRMAVVREKMGEISRKIREARDDFALIFFQQAGCSFCKEQQKILELFVQEYGWDIKSVDVGGRRDVADAFSIPTTPMLLLVSRESGEHLYVSAGVAGKAEIEDSLYRMIRLLKGEISPEEYSAYEFQRGGPFDVKAPLRKR
ncbi:MAG TPA: conjugal transfer protein TraF [Syntrophales bacterium]|nr:conjugal transfer protein TraF [Syntrophales bacterium]